MMGNEDGAIPEWLKSRLRYLQVIPPSRENPNCGVGFASAFEWGISRLWSYAVRALRGEHPCSRAQTSSGENPIVE